MINHETSAYLIPFLVAAALTFSHTDTSSTNGSEYLWSEQFQVLQGCAQLLYATFSVNRRFFRLGHGAGKSFAPPRKFRSRLIRLLEIAQPQPKIRLAKPNPSAI